MRNESEQFRSRAGVLVALLALLALPACGDHNLVLKVDVLSYLDPASVQYSFGPVPAVPGGIATDEQPLVANEQINLFGNLGDVAEVHAVSMHLKVHTQTTSGDGTDTLRIYLSDPNTAPTATTPVLVMPITLTSGATQDVEGNFDGDSRVLDLFHQEKMNVAITTSLRGPDLNATASALSADLAITGIDAVVVSGRKMN